MTSSKDLGTYFLRVQFTNGEGYIEKWNTGGRYTNGCEGWSPLNAMYIPPSHENEESLFDNMKYMYLEGNYGCDCNRMSFLARSKQEEEKYYPCGEILKLKKLTAIRPNRTEVELFNQE